MVLLLAAIEDSQVLDVLGPSEMLLRLERGLTVGGPNESRVVEVLEIADQLISRFVEQIHDKYQREGASRVDQPVPSLRATVSSPPTWLPRYMDLLAALRANPAVARDLPQTAELACFDALTGGEAYMSSAFDHLFTPEHRQLLRIALRTLRGAVGDGLVSELNAKLAQVNFERVAPSLPDRRATPARANTEVPTLADTGDDTT
jgi:hypothetical protein